MIKDCENGKRKGICGIMGDAWIQSDSKKQLHRNSDSNSDQRRGNLNNSNKDDNIKSDYKSKSSSDMGLPRVVRFIEKKSMDILIVTIELSGTKMLLM